MFALGVRYLNGWAMAMHPSDRERAEWPPHPDRVFMALAAAHFESDGGDAERAALTWLQSLPPPAMAVGQADQRGIVTSFVPVNDTEISRRGNENARLAGIDKITDLRKAKAAGLALLPEHRTRQARAFPVAIPVYEPEFIMRDGAGMPRVYLIWEAATPSESDHRALESLCRKVTSVGHSASFVQAWIESSPPAPTLVPIDGVAARHWLRVPGAGRLDHLVSRYEAGLRPAASLWQGYGAPEAATMEQERPSSRFDADLLILGRVEGPRLGPESSLMLTEALRGVVMSRCPVQPPPAWISGHAPDGSPSQDPHLAFIALPDVGHSHAEGRLLGVAIAVPRGVRADEQIHLGAVLFETTTGEAKAIELRTRAGVWKVQLGDEDPRIAMRPETWTASPAGSTVWATATPVVFDRHAKETWRANDPPRVRAEKHAAYWAEIEGMIARACENVGLPRPAEVAATPASVFRGAPSAGQMPRMLRNDRTQRRQTHALIRFDQPVIGPVLLGAGRYRGYGLCRPWRDGGQA
jgi:CRISPR-associated protein Csb2